MSSIPNNNAGPAHQYLPPVGSRESNTEQLMDSLCGPNAYKNPVGILMTVLATVEKAQLKVRQELGQAECEVTKEAGDAAKATANTQMQSGISDAIGEGVKGAVSGASAVHGVKATVDRKALYNQHTDEVNTTQQEIDFHSTSTEGFGERPSTLPAGVDREKHLQSLQSKKKEQVSRRDHEVETQSSHTEAVGKAFHLSGALAGAGSSAGSAQAKASQVNAQQTQENLKGIKDAIQSAERNAMDVANQATSQDPSRIMIGR